MPFFSRFIAPPRITCGIVHERARKRAASMRASLLRRSNRRAAPLSQSAHTARWIAAASARIASQGGERPCFYEVFAWWRNVPSTTPRARDARAKRAVETFIKILRCTANTHSSSQAGDCACDSRWLIE
jgi:hypothetical protein